MELRKDVVGAAVESDVRVVAADVGARGHIPRRGGAIVEALQQEIQ